MSKWDGNLLGVDGGGWAGHIFYTGNPLGLIDAVKLGYAALNTDAGHEGNDGSFIAGHPEQCDFDPGTLLCKGPDIPDCLTAHRVDLMRQIYLARPQGKAPLSRTRPQRRTAAARLVLTRANPSATP